MAETLGNVVDENGYVGFGAASGDGDEATHIKRHVSETDAWEDGVYQIETGDYVIGGANGVMNLPHRQLANRTTYLKQRLKELRAQVVAMGGDTTDYDALLAQIKSMDASALKNQVAHLERLVGNLYLQIQAANIDPDGFDGALFETFDNGAADIDRVSVDVTSVVSGDNSVDVADASGLIIGAHYQLTDGEALEEVQIKSINVSGRIQRVVLYENVQNQYAEGKAKLYRSSVAIYNGRAYGGGNKRTDTWDVNTTFGGSDTRQNISDTINYDNDTAYELDEMHIDNGRIVLGFPVVGVVLKASGGGNGTWGHVDDEGSDV